MNFCDLCRESIDRCQCAERMKWASDAARSAGLSMKEMSDHAESVHKAITMSASNTGGPILGGRSGSFSNFRVGTSGNRPTSPPPQRSAHEHTIAQLIEGAINQGVDGDKVGDVVRKVYSRAALHDRSTKWIEDTVRGELKSLVGTSVHNVAYDDAEDVAVMGVPEFLDRVQPQERYASWNDAAAATTMRFGETLTEVERIRNLGYGPVITIFETDAPGHGIVATDNESGTVVCCALAGVDVRFRVKTNQPLRMKQAVEKSRMNEMLKHGLERRKNRADEELLQAIQSSMKKGRR